MRRIHPSSDQAHVLKILDVNERWDLDLSFSGCKSELIHEIDRQMGLTLTARPWGHSDVRAAGWSWR